jgi:peptidoglycan hydrolase-like protein with peptidoglycan-binding domain
VRRYQQMRGLSIDGEVGEQTWASIAQGLRGPGV